MKRVLRIGLPGYMCAVALVIWVEIIPAIRISVTTGRTPVLIALVLFGAMVTGLVAVFALGSAMLWRWAFWGNVVFVALDVVLPTKGMSLAWLVYLGDAIAIALVALSVIAAIRWGPWAMRSVTARPRNL